jgi:hypothetical protein
MSVLIIDQDQTGFRDNDSEPDGLNYFFYAFIAIVYAAFLFVLVDKLIDSDDVEKQCGSIPLIQYVAEDGESVGKIKKCKKLRKDANGKKFVYLLIFGVLSAIGGFAAISNDKKYLTAGSGIALGGLWVVFYEIIINWSDLNTNAKIFFLGASLATLLYGSVKLL